MVKMTELRQQGSAQTRPVKDPVSYPQRYWYQTGKTILIDGQEKDMWASRARTRWDLAKQRDLLETLKHE